MTSQYRKVAPARLDQREAVRHQVILERVSLRRHTKKPCEVRLLDLSIYGCHLEIEGIFAVGERLWLRLAGGNPIAATAVWCENNKLGCRFDDALDHGVFRKLILLSD